VVSLVNNSWNTAIYVESLLTWGASCILSPLRPPVKVWVPPEFIEVLALPRFYCLHFCLSYCYHWLLLCLINITLTIRWDCFIRVILQYEIMIIVFFMAQNLRHYIVLRVMIQAFCSCPQHKRIRQLNVPNKARQCSGHWHPLTLHTPHLQWLRTLISFPSLPHQMII
jgi:hypothetical protein